MKTEHFHTNDVYALGTPQVVLDWTQANTSHAQLDMSPLSSAKINNSEQLHNKLGETQLAQLSYK